jgi:hypothetical protein
VSGNVLDERQAGRPTPLLDLLTLRFHALAESRDWIADTFGEGEPVDASDPAALRRAWLQQLKRAMADNPEQMFAIKVGGGLLTLAVIAILAAVAAF